MSNPIESRSSEAAREPVRLDIAARRYLGVPFLHQGRNPAIGLDCVGLLSVCAEDLSLTEYLKHDNNCYARDPAYGQLDKRLRDAFGPPVLELLPGRVVSICFFADQTRHVGIIGVHPFGLSLIHTSSSVKRVTERRLTDSLIRRIVAIYEVTP